MKKIIKVSLAFIALAVVFGIVFFTFLVRYEVDPIEAQVKENSDNTMIIVDYSKSLNKCYSYSISNKSGVYSVKIKTAPFFGSDWPKTIIIDEKLDNIKLIEITDGSKSKDIYSKE